jgi:dolichol-phosphate mannosyltransferase
LPGAWLILPTYNEAENIEGLVRAALARLETTGLEHTILVVDDGSPDGTGVIADRLTRELAHVRVLHRERKEGLGRAYLAGFAIALDNGAELVLEMDADFSHDPAHLPQFLDALSSADLVIGSRYRNNRVTVVNWPVGRLMLSYFANVYARVVTGLQLFDSTAGFKCFRRQVLEAVDLGAVKSSGYAFQIEMNFRAWKKGFRIVEIPIVFVDRTEGESKMSKKIVREAVWMVWRLRWWSIRGKV